MFGILVPLARELQRNLSWRCVTLSFIYNEKDIAIFLILSSLFVFKLAFKRSIIREKIQDIKLFVILYISEYMCIF